MATPEKDVTFWNKTAAKYARDPIADIAGYEKTLDRTRDFLKASDTVFEIGCGTGTTALKLAPGVGQLIATDVSEEMIAIARRKAETEGCENISFSVGDAASPTNSDQTYDAVLAFNLLHLANRAETIPQMYRLLKPGGYFISKTPCLSEMNILIRYAVPIAKALGKAPSVYFFTAPQLQADIAAAGFTIVASERHGTKGKDARIFIAAQKPAAQG